MSLGSTLQLSLVLDMNLVLEDFEVLCPLEASLMLANKCKQLVLMTIDYMQMSKVGTTTS